MSFEIHLNTCLFCHKVFKKAVYESRNRREGRKYCSLKCAKADFKSKEIGWFGMGRLTINTGRKTIDDIAPRIWTDQEYKEFEENYPELSTFT